MLSQMYFNSCVQLWTLFAQVVPGTPAASGAPAASGVPAAASPAATAPVAATPAAAASTLPATTTVPINPAAPPVIPGASPMIDYTMPAQQTSVVSTVMHGVLLLLYFLVCVGLIVCVMFQTTKNEGLSGVIGGTATTSLFRGKKSAEETLSLWTSRLAIAFIVLSMVIWFLFGRGSA